MLGPEKEEVLNDKLYSLRLSFMNVQIMHLSTIQEHTIYEKFTIEYVVHMHVLVWKHQLWTKLTTNV